MYLYCTAPARAGAGGNHNGFLGFLSAVAFKWYTLTTNNNIVCSYIVYVVPTLPRYLLSHTLLYPPVDTVYITTLYSLILLRASRVTRRASRITKVKTCMRRAHRQVSHTFPA